MPDRAQVTAPSYAEARPVSTAHECTSGQFHAGLPPTVQRGSGSTPRSRHVSTVGRGKPSRSAISMMPTGSQSSMSRTVVKVLTPSKKCGDNHYMNNDATTTTKTPGFNCRLGIFFDHDKNGRKVAYRWGGRQMRAFRMPLADAELFIATDQADLLDGHPLKP